MLDALRRCCGKRIDQVMQFSGSFWNPSEGDRKTQAVALPVIKADEFRALVKINKDVQLQSFPLNFQEYVEKLKQALKVCGPTKYRDNVFYENVGVLELRISTYLHRERAPSGSIKDSEMIHAKFAVLGHWAMDISDIVKAEVLGSLKEIASEEIYTFWTSSKQMVQFMKIECSGNPEEISVESLLREIRREV